LALTAVLAIIAVANVPSNKVFFIQQQGLLHKEPGGGRG
jgi:hypothetical protein